MSKKILLVEDEELLAMLLAAELEDAGFAVEHAGDGYEAIKKLESESYDGILTDLYMPSMDGLQFLETINVREQTVPVAVVTGSRNREVSERLRAMGVTRVFYKPMDQKSLQQLIQVLESG